MKSIYTSLKPGSFILLFIFLCFNPAIDCFAQGTWIEQSTNPSMSGVYRTKAGSDCIIHTKASSRYVYFFDINSKAWVEADLGIQQKINAVEAGKHVVFAYTDSLLIAYSSITHTYQAIVYSGNILSPEGSVSGSRGYGCGDNASYAWTDQNYFYVFDGLAGQWTLFYSGPVGNATGASNFWCGDTYVAGVFQRFYPDKCRNVAYSLVTKTFTLTETGGVYYTESDGIAMTGGFVSTYGGSPEEVNLVGYSAFTGQFYIKTENTPYSALNLGSHFDSDTWKDCEKRNVYGYNIQRGTAENGDVKINTFDTERAAWITHAFSFSGYDLCCLSNYIVGGNTTICSMTDKSEAVIFYVYSGETGDYHISTAGIQNKGHSYYYNVGNDYASALDDWNHAWFYNTKTGIEQSLTFGESDQSNVIYSTDYISFCKFEPESSTMDLWFYNSKTDRESKIEISNDVHPHYQLSPYSFVFVPSTAADLALFYSPAHDSIMAVTSNLAGPNSIYSTVGVFSWLTNTNTSTSTLLFDAANLTLIDFESRPVSNGISESLILFMDGHIFKVYDASNQTTSTFDLAATPGLYQNKGNIILLGTSNYSKFYAFQKGLTDFVELVPEGNSLYYSASQNTAVVARFGKVYAFAPDAFTNIEKDESDQPGTVKLNQNYPNPFTTNTTITWKLPQDAHVVLKVYDFTGREIKTLMDYDQPKGELKVNFDATGLPAGIYFYQLRANGKVGTKKMICIK